MHKNFSTFSLNKMDTIVFSKLIIELISKFKITSLSVRSPFSDPENSFEVFITLRVKRFLDGLNR
jgi:hypothetical protein